MELQNIWFFLRGLLRAVYFITDGFDLGLGSLLPFLAKNTVPYGWPSRVKERFTKKRLIPLLNCGQCS